MPDSLPSNVASATPELLVSDSRLSGKIDYRDGCFAAVEFPDGTSGYQYQILAPAGEATPNHAVRADDPRIPVGVNTTITLAALTPTGSQGSLTIVNGYITAVVQPS